MRDTLITHNALSFDLANACSSTFSYWWAILSKCYISWKSKPNEWDKGVNEEVKYKKAIKKYYVLEQVGYPSKNTSVLTGCSFYKDYSLLGDHQIFIQCRRLFNLQNKVRISLGTEADLCPIQQVPESAYLH